MVTITSSSSTPKTSFDFLNNSNSYRLSVPLSSSSSSTLSSKEEAFVTTKNLMEPKEEKLGDETVKKALEDPEIGVFEAEKYFNGGMDSDNSSSVLSLTNPESERFDVNSKQPVKKSTATPSICSESSWNSQSILLQNKVVNISLQEKKNNSGRIQKLSNKKKSFLTNVGSRCGCSDANSVDVSNKIENQKNSSVNLNTELIKIEKQEVLVQKKSFEVFGSPINSEKKLSLLPWITRTEEEENTKSEGSDTSSDLFEIESLNPKPKTSLARQGSVPPSPICYAPSEVSIEWSIVTASVADFSVMSECATSPVTRNRTSQIPRNPKSSPQRRKSSSSGLFLGCKSHKSVRVSGDSERKSRQVTKPSYVPRFSMEISKPNSFETRRKVSKS